MGNTPSSTSPPIRPPMKIHQIHGKNLTISSDRLQAKRHEGYSDGLFFGSRPAFHKEQLEITVIKIISEWNGALRFGFTTHNPIAISSHPEGIPRYMCPDLIKRGGSYVETISQISLRAKDKIVFWLEPTGEVSLKVNEVMQKCQLHGINKDVWPVIDVYGNTVEVSFRSLDDNMDHINPPSKPRYYSSLRLTPFQICANVESVDFDESTVRKTNPKKAYVWNKIPLQINTVWVLFVNEVDHSIGTNMSIAISKMSPQINRLPENFSEFSRGNGWIFENVYTRMMPGDELAICILDNGVILVAINGEKFETLGKVHPSQFYWLVTDVSCSVTSLASVGIYKMTRYPLPILPIIENFSDLEIQTSQSSLPTIGASGGGDFKKSQSLMRESSLSQIGREESFLTPESDRNSSEFFRERRTECVICLDSVPDNVFIPCGHVCCCKACADNLMNEHGNILCPACRVKIEHSYKVFL